jgi:putative FmdB family regulatory protein
VPLYEFDCEPCGSFERRLSFESAKAVQACPACARPAQRVFTLAYFRATPTTLDVARDATRDRVKRAYSGEPRLERRPLPEPAKPSWQPLHGAQREGHSH